MSDAATRIARVTFLPRIARCFVPNELIFVKLNYTYSLLFRWMSFPLFLAIFKSLQPDPVDNKVSTLAPLRDSPFNWIGNFNSRWPAAFGGIVPARLFFR
jgi:hypothetical protein